MEVTYYPGTTTNHLCRCKQLSEHRHQWPCDAIVTKSKDMCRFCENDHQEEEYD